MVKAKRGLGKGLGALMTEVHSTETPQGVMEVDIFMIDTDLSQPRKNFDEEKLNELAQSVSMHGIMQPVVVYEKEGRYTIIAGERRFRAAKLAGLETIPVIVKNLSKKEILELSLIENIQREDLNAIEQADALKRLMDEYEITQEEAAKRVGKSRSAIANLTRLLGLPDAVRAMVLSGALSAGHARCLLALEEEQSMIATAEFFVKEALSVRQAENFVKEAQKPPVQKQKSVKKIDAEMNAATEELAKSLDTKVKIQGNMQRGKIVIEYFSKEQLEQLYDFLTQN